MDRNKALKIIAKNKEVYNSIAFDFDEKRQHPWTEFEILKKYIKAGNKILDLGCGNGRLYHYLKQEARDTKYTGIDQSEELTAIARKKYPEADFMVTDIFNLPFGKNSFDLIAAIAFLHHIPGKDFHLALLHEIHRVLKPGGIFFMMVWNLWQRRLIKKYSLKLRHFFLPHQGLEAGDFWIPYRRDKKIVLRYYHHFWLGELKQLAARAGFKILKFKKERNLLLVLKK